MVRENLFTSSLGWLVLPITTAKKMAYIITSIITRSSHKRQTEYTKRNRFNRTSNLVHSVILNAYFPLFLPTYVSKYVMLIVDIQYIFGNKIKLFWILSYIKMPELNKNSSQFFMAQLNLMEKI